MLHPQDPQAASSVHVLAAEGGPWAGLGAELERRGCAARTSTEFDVERTPVAELLLLDLELPALQGCDLALAVRRLAQRGAGAVIALTRRGDARAIRRASAAGAFDFIDAHDDLECAAQRVLFALRGMDARLAPRAGHGDERDSLTGLPTRSRFVRVLADALERARARHANLAVLCFDLDRFRQLTGSLQPSAADDLVFAVSRRFQEAVREHDVFARLGCTVDESGLARVGGEEFTLLLENLSDVDDAAKVARRVIELTSQPFAIAGQELYLTLSVGIASLPLAGALAEDLLKSAETAAYCARQQGRNSLRVFAPAMNTRAFERLTLETSLRHAIERDELVLHYQPRVEIATGRTVGMEALVRWRHPQLGLVAPAQFIPLAEETGLILPLGEWVLRSACEQNRAWQRRGLPSVRMSVNVSPVQFRQPDLCAAVLRTLDASGLDPRWLELELTETSLMSDFEAVATTLQHFKDVGIGLSIDDFGTGYSSLAYLRRFPLDALKIDQSFLREVTTNQDDASIVTAIVLMGKSLGLTMVAEGVETPGQLAFMRIMKCDEAQGFLFSRPVPAADAERFLSARIQAAA